MLVLVLVLMMMTAMLASRAWTLMAYLYGFCGDSVSGRCECETAVLECAWEYVNTRLMCDTLKST